MFSALLGDPVDQSVSPIVFNYFSQKANIEYSHLKIKSNRENLSEIVDSLKTINCVGFNITLPHKITMYSKVQLLDETARKAKAVNTVKVLNGKMKGYNTDGKGAIKAIQMKLRNINQEDKITILGSGGCARGIISELLSYTSNISILARNIDEADELNHVYNNKLKVFLLNEENMVIESVNSDYIINCTPVGMNPNNQSLYTKEVFEEILIRRTTNKELMLFDAVFNPAYTKFLELGRTYNLKVCSGIWMLIYQAVYAFYIWTDQEIILSPEEEKELYHKLTVELYKD